MEHEKIINRCRKSLLAGFFLIGMVFFTPDVSRGMRGGFFRLATQSTWNKFLELPAAWCSCKIILLSLGLFLVIECLGTILAVFGLRRLAWVAYLLHVLPSVLFLMGSYYVIKALL